MVEIESTLKGRSLLIIESEKFTGFLFQECLVGRNMDRIVTSDHIPNQEGLLEFMNNNGLDAAIIHTSNPEDEKNIMKANDAGKKILIITRDPLTKDEIAFYENLEQKGVATITKGGSTSIKELVDPLEELFY